MKRLIIFCLLICSTILSGAQKLSIKVIDDKSLPVSGASVQILNTPYSGTTNKEGLVIVEKIVKGNHLIYIENNGYATTNKHVTINDSINVVEVILLPGYKQLDEVIISIQKFDELQQRVPISVKGLSSKQVLEYRLWNMNDITAIAPNLYTADPGDKRNVTSIRGVVSTSYDQAVATYIDGVNQFGLDTYISQLFDVERIEIARGPQGTLYGRNAMGGVINIITKQPGNKIKGFAEASVGNHGQKRFSAGIRVPIIKDRLFFGAAGLFEKSGGYYTNVFDNSSYDKQHATTANYYLKYQTKKHWNFSLNMKHAANRNSGPFPLVFGKEQAFKDPYKLDQDAITKMIDNIINGSLSITYTNNTFYFQSQTAYQTNYRYYKDPIDADFSSLDAISIINNYGRDWNKVIVATQEFRLSSVSNEKIKWNAGSYLFYQYIPFKQTTYFGNDAQMIGAPDTRFYLTNTSTSKNKGLAFYGQVNYKPIQKLELIAGIRFDHENKYQSINGAYEKENGPSFITRTDTMATVNFNSVSPKVSIAFYPAETQLFFVTYSKGFRAGGLTPLSSDPSQPPLFEFKPETSNNIEAGIKNTFFNKRLTVNFSLFYTTLSNIQVPTLVLPDAVTITRNTGKLTSKGLEIEARTVLKSLEVDYSFGYTNATYKTLKVSQNSEEVDLHGRHQIFTPSTTSMLATQYSFGLNNDKKIKLVIRGEWKFLGKQYFDLANTIEQDPYHILNARLGVVSKTFSLILWARNLNDARFISYAYDFGAVHLNNPRTYGVTVNYLF